MEGHQTELLQSLQAQGRTVKALQQSLADAAKREKRLDGALEAQVSVSSTSQCSAVGCDHCPLL